MKVNIRKIFGLILMIILLSLIFSGKVFASEASLSYPNSCEKGNSFTVTINIPQDAVAYDIGGAVVTFSDGSTQSLSRKGNFNPSNMEWPGNCSYTFEARVAGNANISVNDIVIVDSNANTINSQSSLSGSVNITDSNPTPPVSNNSSSPDNTPPPAEVVVVNFKNVNETMYISEGSTGVNMRQNCGTGTGIITNLKAGTEVTRTGIGDKSKDGYYWSRISYDGETGYVITSRLTYDKPEEKPPENTVENNTISDNTVENDITNNTVVNGVKNIADELGAIPEVGLNIMTFIFVGSCTVCCIITIYVKRKIAK